MLAVGNRYRPRLARVRTLLAMSVLSAGSVFVGLHDGIAFTGVPASQAAIHLPASMDPSPAGRPGGLAPPAVVPSRLLASAAARVTGAAGATAFEENRGQVDGSAEFLARTQGFSAVLTPRGAILFPGGHQPGRLLLQFAGSAAVQGVGEGRLPGTVSYIDRRDPTRRLAGIATYSRVRYAGVYPGVDLVYHAEGGQLEYDFDVAATADPGRIRITVGGASAIRVGRDGSLDVESRSGTLSMRQPVAYQTGAGGWRSPVPAGFVADQGQTRLTVGAYDRTRPLVIDPVLSYSTYLGGPSNDYVRAIAVDGAGNAYVTGETWSNAFPTTPGAYKTSCGNSGDCVYDSNLGNFRSDAFVTKLGPSGTVVWSTFIGGHTVCCGGIPVDSRNYDRGNGIAVDSAGQVVVVGTTDATDFPTTPNAISPTYTTGLSKAFIAKLNAAGTDLVYSTFFGGSHTVEGNGVTLDAGGDAYVVGNTNSPDMLVTSGAFQPTCGQGAGCATWESNAFAAKLSPTGSLLASTYLGSGDPAGGATDRGHAIDVDGSGNAYLMGMTTHVLGSTTVKPFPTTPGAYSTTYRGLGDVFVSKLNSSFTQLVYSTLLGGTGDDSDQWGGIAVDPSGTAVVTGYTNSTDFPTVNAIQPAYGGGFYDAFAARLDPTGSALVYSTYLGGVYDDYGYAATVDGLGNAYLTGSTLSPNFPVGNATPTELPGNRCGTDYCLLAFLTELAPSGSLVYSDELGGTQGQEALGLAIDNTGAVYLGGDTFSPDFPTLAPAQPAYAGGDCSATTDSHTISIVVYRCGDGFVTKLLPDKFTAQLRATTSPALPSQILVDGVIRDSWGLNWVDLPTGTHTVSFTHVEGYTEPAPQSVTISAGVVSTLAGDFVQRGSLRVITSPAVPGAISVDGSPRNDWGMWTDLSAGQHQVCFGPVANFTPPACQSVTLTAGSLSTITGVYTSGSGQPGPAGTGQLRVTTNPALPSQILVNGTPMDSWGLNWVDLAPGTYTVAFTHVEGYTEPAPQTVTVSAGAVASVQANFTQRGSLRVITSPAAPATIVVDGLPRDNWGMWTDLAAGSHTVCFGRAAGLVSPPCQTATIVAGQLTTVTGTFTPST